MQDYFRYKDTNKPILILGDTGSGKSKLAKELHKRSKFKNTPFLSINITALSDSLFESELFGHSRGAFTGADRDKEGYLDRVGAGSLFIDEIGDLSLSKQAKLLHLLDDGGYFPVGSTKRRVFQGRFIFATNKSLSTLVAKKEFREDLFFRIRFFQVKLKPIRDLSVDQLERKIWEIINDKKIERQNFSITFDQEVIDALKLYSWPGNFRELSNTIDYFYELSSSNIRKEDLPDWICSHEQKQRDFSDYKSGLESFEKTFLEKSMFKYHGQINYTAKCIGLSKVTLISKLKKYAINRKDYQLGEEAVGF